MSNPNGFLNQTFQKISVDLPHKKVIAYFSYV